jgi:hypothetical protein
MPRLIDAEKMPQGSLWEELTDKEKANVLCYLISQPGVDVVRLLFEEFAGILISTKSDPEVCWTTKTAFNFLLDKYHIEGGIEI